MKSLHIKIALLLILIIFLPAILSLFIRNTVDFDQPSLNRAQKVYGGVSLSQTFVSSSDYLSGIGLSIKNPNLINKKDLNVSIYDEDNNLLSKLVKNGSVIADGNFVKLFFNPITFSRGKEFTVTFNAEGANESEALEIYLTDDKPQWMGNLLINNQESNERISMQTFYNTKNYLSAGLEIYQQWFQKMTGDLFFAVTYVLLISVGVGYLIFGFRKK